MSLACFDLRRWEEEDLFPLNNKLSLPVAMKHSDDTPTNNVSLALSLSLSLHEILEFTFVNPPYKHIT